MTTAKKIQGKLRKDPQPVPVMVPVCEVPLSEWVASKAIARHQDYLKRRTVKAEMTLSKQGECPVCCEMGTLYAMNLCLHRACKNCINHHFEVRQQDNQPLTCTECTESVNIKQLGRLKDLGIDVDYYLYQKRYMSDLIKYANGLTPCPKMTHTLSRSTKCTGYGRPTAWLGVLLCDTCKQTFCKFCKGSHKGGCDKIDMLDGGAKDRWLKSMDMVQCPKCEEGIQRISGCKYVVCTCGMNVCMGCGKASTKSHFMHNCKMKGLGFG